MKSERLKQEPIGSNGRLVEVKLFSDGAYYFVYEKGIVFKLTKDDLKAEEMETRKIINKVEL
ncbi:MAG: hypothetical protein QXZ70_06810 [Candidatus Bathyarchaeia archaeon]